MKETSISECKYCKKGSNRSLIDISNRSLEKNEKTRMRTSNVGKEEELLLLQKLKNLNFNNLYLENDMLIEQVNQSFYRKAIEKRASILSWLRKINYLVTKNYTVFYTAVAILDIVIKHYNFYVSTDNMFMIAISAYYISIKYHEYGKRFSLNFIISNVCHFEFDKKDIVSTELLILGILKYKIPDNQFEDFLFLQINKIVDEDNSLCLLRKKLLKNATKIYYNLLKKNVYNEKVSCFKIFVAIFMSAFEKLNLTNHPEEYMLSYRREMYSLTSSASNDDQ